MDGWLDERRNELIAHLEELCCLGQLGDTLRNLPGDVGQISLSLQIPRM
jgi:hypothetical protein